MILLVVVAACSEGEPEAAPTTTTSTTLVYGGHESEIYADPAHWLCRPDTDDVCDRDLDATVVAAGGTTELEAFTPTEDSPIDCFYVYPTISRDPGPNSDLSPAPESELYVVRQQAARLGAECRLYAPVYRQTTLTALTDRLAGRPPPAVDSGEIAYADVLDAWKHYVDNDNEGRGVVLVGHSQGAGLLTRLVREEIDGSSVVRDRLVSALLLGTSVRVPAGEDVGGDFADVPACRAPDDLACVDSYASFRAEAPPPPNSFFGRPRDGSGEALCTNPASLSGGSGELTPYFQADGASLLGAPAEQPPWLQGSRIETPFVALPGLVSAECVRRDGFSYLALTTHGDAAEPRIDGIGGDLTPEWGMHLVDVNVAMGNLVDLVAAQAEAWAAR